MIALRFIVAAMLGIAVALLVWHFHDQGIADRDRHTCSAYGGVWTTTNPVLLHPGQRSIGYPSGTCIVTIPVPT